MAKVRVTDAAGVRWRVYRRWGFNYWRARDEAMSGDAAEAGLIIDLLQVVVISPFWFIAKWFGVPWTIVIERNGTEVGDVRVRGWRKSKWCIQDIVESAADGTLEEKVAAQLPSVADFPPDMAVTPEAWAKLTPEARVTLWRMYNSGGLRRN